MEINLGIVLVTLVVLIIAVAVLWAVLSKLYQRSTTERAFVRTGFMGQRVAISGGALVIPVLHEVTWVNMNTLRISLSHHNENALITLDRLRMNVDADFYVRVTADPVSVTAAARSLGIKTSSVDAMRELLEARFNDALRTAAAKSTMEHLHENRSEFSSQVRALASAGIDTSGLEIDSVSISKLDQASREFFNPNNAFDAAGLTILTAEIEERRRSQTKSNVTHKLPFNARIWLQSSRCLNCRKKKNTHACSKSVKLPFEELSSNPKLRSKRQRCSVRH